MSVIMACYFNDLYIKCSKMNILGIICNNHLSMCFNTIIIPQTVSTNVDTQTMLFQYSTKNKEYFLPFPYKLVDDKTR